MSTPVSDAKAINSDDDLREHGEEVLKKVRAMNRRDFNTAIARDRLRRSDDEVKAAYAQAMKEKAGKS